MIGAAVENVSGGQAMAFQLTPEIF